MADNIPRAQTSGQLQFRAMRLYERRKRARRILNAILAASAAFTSLPDEKQDMIRQECEIVIRDNINEFMDNTPPRTVYPYEEAVLAAVKSVVYWNPDVLVYNEDDWIIPAEDAGGDTE
ncbi:hypothetical protein PG997_010252 [Apiospora hydei]|uniref:Uncharacterized protein n=1 Tax=Apiospora hydei TaxID=1337664 RepID=A0ABR1W082_9PEZI